MSELAKLKALFNDYEINLDDETLEQYFYTWLYLNSPIEFYDFCVLVLSLLLYTI